LLAFRRSVGYAFESAHVQFVWPPSAMIASIAVGCVFFSAAIGLLGASVPAWRAGQREPYELIRGEVH
jgi:hypothetical protein